jgi:CRISPR/Cas system-associated exonuclease Cas4 (RecB family)
MENATIALSFSRLSDYEQCPLKFKQKYIDKSYPDDSNNPAFAKGNALHKQMEDYVNWLRSTDRNPEDKPIMTTVTQAAVPMVESLYDHCNGNLFPEKQLAVDQDWFPCDWYDKPHKVKYRAIIDCMAFVNSEELLVIDWKSGKVRPYEDGPTTQLKLTAVILFNLYPKIQRITSSYMFLEHKKTVKKTFHREDLEAMQTPFDEAHLIINTVEEFPHKKNQYCNWCLSTDCPIKK